jgi:trehalose 6-phosphate synthase/phosphatase
MTGSEKRRAVVPPQVIATVQRAPRVILILDYDGTLVPIANAPELAVPDSELLSLLRSLASQSKNELHLVSGRPRHTLERWFGELPVTLWAEHGFWRRLAPGEPWSAAGRVSAGTFDRVLAILEHFTADTPGALVERKTASMAWHYRLADPGLGARQAHELRMALDDALSNQPLEVLEGKKVIEVRLRGVTKAVVAHHIADRARGGTAVVVFGDDRTDEDLFSAVPKDAITIAVGPSLQGAAYAVDGPKDVRALLQQFAR